MDRDLYAIEEFKEGRLPAYRCPRCNSGLTGDPHSLWDANSRSMDDLNPSFDYEDALIHFRIDLQCPNSQCGQIVFCIGTGRYVEGDRYSDQQYVEKYRPLMFTPYLRPFVISDYVPYEVQECMKASFQLLFANNGSALNEVRKALERLMDHLGVTVVDERKQRLNLHRRIQLMPPAHHELKELMLASKVLGNSGSHGSEVDREAVLDAYEMMDIVLEEMFNGRIRRAKELAAQIIKRNGPIDILTRNLGEVDFSNAPKSTGADGD